MRISFRIDIGGDGGEKIAATLHESARLLPPGAYRVTIEPVTRERTNEQNRFYWRILAEIADATGNTNEALHEHFRARFLQDRSVNPARIRSTTELSVREFNQYIDRILEFVGSELGIVVRLDH